MRVFFICNGSDERFVLTSAAQSDSDCTRKLNAGLLSFHLAADDVSVFGRGCRLCRDYLTAGLCVLKITGREREIRPVSDISHVRDQHTRLRSNSVMNVCLHVDEVKHKHDCFPAGLMWI